MILAGPRKSVSRARNAGICLRLICSQLTRLLRRSERDGLSQDNLPLHLDSQERLAFAHSSYLDEGSRHSTGAPFLGDEGPDHAPSHAVPSVIAWSCFDWTSREHVKVFGWEWEGELYRLFVERSFLRTMVTRRDPMTLGIHGAEAIRECEVNKDIQSVHTTTAAAATALTPTSLQGGLSSPGLFF